MSVNIFEHPFLKGLLGDRQMDRLFSAKADIDAMVKFELALAQAQGALGVIPQKAADKILNTLRELDFDLDILSIATAQDGVVVPELLRQLRKKIGEPTAQYIHHGATSQDVIDTSLVMRLKAALVYLDDETNKVAGNLDKLTARFASNKIMARTRMQDALETKTTYQVEVWKRPLELLMNRMPDISNQIAQLQLGGPVGDGKTFGDQYHTLAVNMAQLLDLNAPSQCWHTDRTSITSLANWLSELTGTLGKIGQDITIMSMDGTIQLNRSATGGSSAMPHKQNPVSAEILVTLAHFNATQLPALHHALVHENNRSGSMWTLEWMILPQMMTATAAALRTACQLLESIEEFGK